MTLNTHARQAACVHTETKDSRQQQNRAKTYTNESHDNKVRSHSSQNEDYIFRTKLKLLGLKKKSIFRTKLFPHGDITFITIKQMMILIRLSYNNFIVL